MTATPSVQPHLSMASWRSAWGPPLKGFSVRVDKCCGAVPGNRIPSGEQVLDEVDAPDFRVRSGSCSWVRTPSPITRQSRTRVAERATSLRRCFASAIDGSDEVLKDLTDVLEAFVVLLTGVRVPVSNQQSDRPSDDLDGHECCHGAIKGPIGDYRSAFDNGGIRCMPGPEPDRPRTRTRHALRTCNQTAAVLPTLPLPRPHHRNRHPPRTPPTTTSPRSKSPPHQDPRQLRHHRQPKHKRANHRTATRHTQLVSPPNKWGQQPIEPAEAPRGQKPPANSPSATPGHTPIPRMTDGGGSPAGAPSRSGQLAGSKISPSNQNGGDARLAIVAFRASFRDHLGEVGGVLDEGFRFVGSNKERVAKIGWAASLTSTAGKFMKHPLHPPSSRTIASLAGSRAAAPTSATRNARRNMKHIGGGTPASASPNATSRSAVNWTPTT